jgi:hypothetical protein
VTVGEAHLTWDGWLRSPADAAVAPPGRPVLRWAVDVLRDLFGETWLADNAASSETVPLLHHDWWPLNNPRPVIRVLELATRAALVRQHGETEPLLEPARQVGTGTESVMREFKHLCLALEVAAFAITSGWSVAYEQPLPSGRRPDLWLRRNGLEYLVELTITGYDREFRVLETWLEKLRLAFFGIEARHHVDTTHRIEAMLDDEKTGQWLAELDTAARLTAADRTPRTVQHEGAVAEVFLEGQRPTSTVSTGPAQFRDVWGRVATRLEEKAKQTRGGPPAWLRIDDVGTMFKLTDWSAAPLSERLAQLAHNVGVALAGAPHVRGVILTGGDQYAAAGAAGETAWSDSGDHNRLPEAAPRRYQIGDGPAAMRRIIPGPRQRLTFVISTQHRHVLLPAGIGPEPGLWYDDEPTWLDRALRELGHPGLQAIMEGD